MRLIAAALVLLVWLVPGSAFAQQADVDPGRDDVSLYVDATDGREEERGTVDDDGSSSAGDSGSRPRVPEHIATRTTRVGYVDYGEDPPCLRYIRVDTQRSADRVENWVERRAALEAQYDTCPAEEEVDLPDVEDLAEIVWEDVVRLPAPSPAVRPNADGIVAIPVYLEIDGPQTLDARFGPDEIGFDVVIEIDATSEYVVDWGDDTPLTRTTSQGGPYPDGDVKHQYPYKGTYDITVTQEWTATWRASTGASGTISGVLRTTGIVEDFVVSEIQAVRER